MNPDRLLLHHRCYSGPFVFLLPDGGMYVTTGEEGEQAAAIASVTPQGTLTLDPTVQYQFRADTAQGKPEGMPVMVSQQVSYGERGPIKSRKWGP